MILEITDNEELISELEIASGHGQHLVYYQMIWRSKDKPSSYVRAQSLSAIQHFTIAIVSALPFVGVVDLSVSELKLELFLMLGCRSGLNLLGRIVEVFSVYKVSRQALLHEKLHTWLY